MRKYLEKSEQVVFSESSIIHSLEMQFIKPKTNMRQVAI